MTSVEELLDEIRSVATDEHDKGDKFEQLMLHAFKTDRMFRQQLPTCGGGWSFGVVLTDTFQSLSRVPTGTFGKPACCSACVVRPTNDRRGLIHTAE